MTVNWIKCSGNQWCNLTSVNLEHPHFHGLEGVYIIWHGAPNPAVVYVGQGEIRSRLAEHREDKNILAFKERGLYVTWAKVDEPYRNGIERYLADKWRPQIGESYPYAEPIAVNSPWEN